MEASQAQSLAVRSSTDLEAITELEAILLGDQEAPKVVDDPVEISREIMRQLLGAETDAELEAIGSATGWRELEGVPIELQNFRWRPSAFDEGHAVFFIVQGTRLDTGERVVLTTGAGNVLAQLCNLARRDRLVGAVRMIVRADTPTSNGYYPLWLKTPNETDAAA